MAPQANHPARDDCDSKQKKADRDIPASCQNEEEEPASPERKTKPCGYAAQEMKVLRIFLTVSGLLKGHAGLA